jgi:hypothetical protein
MNKALYTDDDKTYGPYTLPEASIHDYTTRAMGQQELDNMVIGGSGSLEYIGTPLLFNAKRFMTYKNLHPQTSRSIKRRFLRKVYDSKINQQLIQIPKILYKLHKQSKNPLSGAVEDINFDIPNVPYNYSNIGPKY